jgi:hypothetical protein
MEKNTNMITWFNKSNDLRSLSEIIAENTNRMINNRNNLIKDFSEKIYQRITRALDHFSQHSIKNEFKVNILNLLNEFENDKLFSNFITGDNTKSLSNDECNTIINFLIRKLSDEKFIVQEVFSNDTSKSASSLSIKWSLNN